jgi:hypothetical protein
VALEITQFAHRRKVGPQPAGDDHFGLVVALQGFLHECQSRRIIAFLGNKALKHPTFMINSAPQVMQLSFDPHVHLIEVPAPLPETPHPIHPLAPDIGCEHRPETIPPVPYRHVTDVDPALEKPTLDVAQAQRETNLNQDYKPNHLPRGVETTKRTGRLCHRFARHSPQLTAASAVPHCSDSAFEEDKRVLEAQQRVLDSRPDSWDLALRSDAGSIESRRVLQDLIDREQAAMADAA